MLHEDKFNFQHLQGAYIEHTFSCLHFHWCSVNKNGCFDSTTFQNCFCNLLLMDFLGTTLKVLLILTVIDWQTVNHLVWNCDEVGIFNLC